MKENILLKDRNIQGCTNKHVRINIHALSIWCKSWMGDLTIHQSVHLEEKRLDVVMKETERNRQMVSQILSATFTSQGKDGGVLCSGRKVIIEN